MKKQGVYLNDKQVTRDASAYAIELVKGFLRAMGLTARMDVYSRQDKTVSATIFFVDGKETNGPS